LLEHPSKLLVGSCARGSFHGFSDPRLPRLVVTSVLLVMVISVRDGCGVLFDDQHERVFCKRLNMSFSYDCDFMFAALGKGKCAMDQVCVWEREPEPDLLHKHFVDIFINVYHDHLWPAWNRQTLELACPNVAHVEGAEEAFFFYQLGIWWMTAVWVILTMLEVTGFRKVSTSVGSQKQLTPLIEQIGAADGVEGIRAICLPNGSNVIPELRFKMLPPGGLYFKVAMMILDCMILDNLSVYNNLVAYKFGFAAALACVVTASLCLQLASTSPWKFVVDCQDAVTSGIMPDSLEKIIDVEQGMEAPLCLCINAYAFAFTISGYFPLVSGMASMMLSVYGVAVFSYEYVDLEIDSKYDSELDAATGEYSELDITAHEDE